MAVALELVSAATVRRVSLASACPGPLASSMAPPQPHLSPVSVPSPQEGGGASLGMQNRLSPACSPFSGEGFQFLRVDLDLTM